MASFEAPATFSVMVLPRRSLAAVNWACTSTRCPALRPDTVHVVPPVVAQTEKVGAMSRGEELSVSLAVPPLPLVSHTKMANCTVLSTVTVLLPLRGCTLRQRVAVGGGVVVGVGVAVLVGVGVAPRVGGGLFDPPGSA